MEMLKKEWSKLIHNKMLLLSSIVILFIPILYASFFLKSNWDPYGHTDQLPVAVVNEDQPVTYEGTELAVGRELIDQLKNNDSLDWHFVSREEAAEGLKNREYYMVMTLPENFSQDASTLMEEHPKKMEIHYETNGSLNYISEIISKTAVTEIKSEVAANVTEAYAQAVFNQIGEVGEGFQEAAEGAEKLSDGTDEAQDGNKKITENLQKLADNTLIFSDGADSLEMGITQYTDGVSQVNDGSQALNEGIHSLSSNVGPLADGVNQLDNGSGSLQTGIRQYTNGVTAVNEGLSQLAKNNAALQNGASTLAGGASQVKNGSSQLLAGLNMMSGSLKDSMDADTQKQLATLLDEENGLPKLNAGIQELNSVLQDAVKSGGTINEGFDSAAIEKSLNDVADNLKGTKGNLEAIGSSLSSTGDILAAAGNAAQPNITAAVQSVAGTSAFQSLTPEQQQELTEALTNTLSSQATEQGQAFQQVQILLESAGASTEAAGENIATVGSAAQNLSSQMQELQAGLGNLERLAAQLPILTENMNNIAQSSNVALPGAEEAIQSLQGGLSSVQDALDRTGEGEQKGLIQGMTELDQGLAALQEGISGKSGLVNGINTYTNGVTQVEKGTAELNQNSGNLLSGATQLHDGIGAMNNQLPNLIAGINQLQNGSETLAEGTAQLDTNSADLKDGSRQISDGAHQIQDGSSQLADGSLKLKEGIAALKDGSSKLAEKLQDGAEEVNSVEANDATLDMFASPAEVQHQEYSHVPNYGVALAPYIMSMALYIGAVVFNTIYPIRKLASKDGSAFSWLLSKLSVAFPSAILMGLIESSIMLLLGLEVQHVGQFVGLAVITSLAFTSLVLFLAITWDNVGRFIAMLLLIVQLGGSGGTFPMPLTNNFFIAIHPFLPMTYSVYGFRQAISGGLGQGIYIQAIVLMIIVTVVSCGLLFVAMHHLYEKDANKFLDSAEITA